MFFGNYISIYYAEKRKPFKIKGAVLKTNFAINKKGISVKPFYFSRFLVLSLSLTACDAFKSFFGSPPPSDVVSKETNLTEEEIQNRCIPKIHNLSQGNERNLYGLSCIEGKRIHIKTKSKEEAKLIHTTTDAGEKLRLEKRDQKTGKTQEVEFIPDMINKYYRVKYEIQEKQEEKHPEWLINLLPLDEDFNGSTDKEYLILFRTLGNYLVLYKASKNIENIPYNERTAIPKNKEGDYITSEDGYYMVPFIGYKTDYCKSEIQKDVLTKRKTNTRIINCENITKKDKPYYIRFDASHDKTPYNYMDKTNVFPAEYFAGRWFFSQGEVERGADSKSHHYEQERAYLVEFERGEHKIGMKDVSGRLSDLNKRRDKLFKVQWKEYEMDCVSHSCGPQSDDTKNLRTFGEREDTRNTFRKKPYVQVDFTEKEDQDVSNIVITENYFSYVTSHVDKITKRRVTIKTSLLRENSINQEGFQEKRWFKDDQEHKFSILRVSPEITEKKPGELEEEDDLRSFRLIRFNTNEKDTIIKWHFSNYTVNNNQDGKMGTPDDDDGDFYRKLGKEAVELWNRAFQIITEEYCLSKGQQRNCKTIKVELVENEADKDLGDLRYNILNLIKSKVIYHTGWLGHAPSYAKADTGQIVGTTANVFIHNTSNIYANYIHSYIRYEIFRKKNNAICSKKQGAEAEEKPELHAVTPYVREKIEERCPEVIDFICEQKIKKPKPRDSLGDSKLIERCERKVSEEVILSTILHEMGHTFGLGHNFKASLDKNNYYHFSDKDHLEELNKYFPGINVSELPKSSSIMDYVPLDAPPITVIGKYDLANLRYLYLDQVESKDYPGYKPENDEETLRKSFLNLKIMRTPEEQLPLDKGTLSQMKVYESCWDTVLNRTFKPDIEEDFLCIMEDYGSSPKEIVEWHIEQANRMMFNSERYAYAKTKEKKNMSKKMIPNFNFPKTDLQRIAGFYQKLDKLREAVIRSIGEADAMIAYLAAGEKTKKESIAQYKKFLEESFCDDKSFEAGSCKKKIYDLYYPVREPIFNFVRENAFLRTMKCEIQNEKGQSISMDLRIIKNKLLPELGPDLEVENCESEQIQNFFKKHKIKYLGQTGLENFQSYFFEGPEKDKIDIHPIYSIINKFMQTMNLGFIIFDPDYLYTIIDEIGKYFELGEENSDKTNGLSKADLFIVETMINMLHDVFAKTKRLPVQINRKMLETLKLNQLYFQYNYFIVTNTGQKFATFHNHFQVPLEKGRDPSDVFSAMPFVKEAYREFSIELTNKPDDWADKNFQDYLLGRDDVLPMTVDGEVEAFFTPILPNGLLQHVYRKYHQLAAEIKKLDEKKEREGLSKWEEMYQESMEIFQDVILRITDIRKR